MSEAIELDETNPPGHMVPFGWWCRACSIMHTSPNTAMGSCQRNHEVIALYRRKPEGPLFITEPVGVAPAWADDAKDSSDGGQR